MENRGRKKVMTRFIKTVTSVRVPEHKTNKETRNEKKKKENK